MRIVVCVKYVPVLSALRFDPGTRRLVREGVPGEASSFDVRALGAALALRRTHGGEVVALTMGPPAARDGLVHCLALGADRALHLVDPLLAGSDTLATARALAAVLTREAPDLTLFGRASADAETGQVGPEVAELLGLPQAPSARRGEIIGGDSPEALVRALAERLRLLVPRGGGPPALPARGAGAGAPVWVVAEMGSAGPKRVTAELLAKAAELAAALGARVE